MQQAFLHPFRHQPFQAASQHGDFLDKVGTEKGEAQAGHHKKGFDIGIQFAVHQGHLEFVFEIGYGPEPPDDHIGILVLGEIDQQSLEIRYFHPFFMVENLTDHLDAIFDGEKRGFFRIRQDSDNDSIEYLQCPVNDVHVSVCDGIEGTGIYGLFIHESCLK